MCFSCNLLLLPSSASRGANISPALSTLRILPVATGVYRFTLLALSLEGSDHRESKDLSCSLTPLDSALPWNLAFCTILVQISPLESALTDTPLVTPLDSALTKTPGGWWGVVCSFSRLPRVFFAKPYGRGALKLSTDNCLPRDGFAKGRKLLHSPAGWPSARRWPSRKRRQAMRSSAAVLALVLNGRFAVHRCRCFLSPATHTEPPAGVLAGLPVTAMPTRNSCNASASAARSLPNSTAGAPTVSAQQPPASLPPGPPRTRCCPRSKTPTAARHSQRNSSRRSAPS